MLSILPERRSVNGRTILQKVTTEAYDFLGHLMSTRLNSQLDKAVDHLLARGRYDRRGGVPYFREQVGACLRCGSHHCDHFSRNGHRPRTLNRWDCELQLRLPRVVCQCGGSVKLDFAGLIRPYQRLGDDLDAQIQRWGAMSVSLREMRAELTHSRLGPLGLRTLMERLHDLQALTPDLDASQVPPILQIDAIWFTELQPTETTQADAAGRQRVGKKGQKRPLFIALGVWPETGRREILAWELGASEDAAAWLKFLTRLEAEGIRGTNGLKLVIHDGGSGLCAALRSVDFGAAEQRCLFHKLRNISRALQFADDVSAQERKRQRRSIMKDFKAIWEAQNLGTALRRYLQVWRQYRTSQPKAAETLRRDFRSTVTYYHLEAAQPTWPRTELRTTSRLERFNRTLRRHMRNANAYHSDEGVLAMVAQAADRYFEPGAAMHKAGT